MVPLYEDKIFQTLLEPLSASSPQSPSQAKPSQSFPETLPEPFLGHKNKRDFRSESQSEFPINHVWKTERFCIEEKQLKKRFDFSLTENSQ